MIFEALVVSLSYLQRLGESLYFRPHTSFNIKDPSIIETRFCSRWWVFNINIFVACSQWALMMQSENIALWPADSGRFGMHLCFVLGPLIQKYESILELWIEKLSQQPQFSKPRAYQNLFTHFSPTKKFRWKRLHRRWGKWCISTLDWNLGEGQRTK